MLEGERIVAILRNQLDKLANRKRQRNECSSGVGGCCTDKL